MEEVASCYYDLGNSFNKSYQLDSATVNFKKARELFDSQSNWEKSISALNKLGIIEKDLGNFASALSLYHESYETAKKQDLKSVLASTCINIGVVLKKQNQLEQALEYYLEAKVIYTKEQDFIGIANAQNNIGNVYRIQGKYDEALNSYRNAIESRLAVKSEKTLSFSYNNISLVFKERGQCDSALYYLKKSEEFKIKLQENSSLSSTYLNFADTYLILKDSTNFIYYFNKAEKFALDYDQSEIIQDLYSTRSKFEYQSGNYKAAYSYLLQVVNHLDTVDVNKQITLGKVLQAKFQDKQKEEVIHQLELSNQELDEQKSLLQKSESRFMWMSITLVIASIILVIVLIVLLRNFLALKKGSDRILSINEELKQTRLSSDEKDILIKEIHHRVKNNLQIIKSLIRLQNASINDVTVTEILHDFENRVSSMALVHESLYKSLDLSKVNVNEYYTQLLKDLITAYAVDVEVEGDFQIEIENFGIDTLIPLGLLTNEIISNALKHGFEGLPKGKITVHILNVGDNIYEMRIGDNGIGMHERFQNKQSLGVELIETLVEQLDGKMTRIIENGTHYIITFKSQDK